MAKETEKTTEHLGVSCTSKQKQKIEELYHEEKTKSKRYKLSFSAWIVETLLKGQKDGKRKPTGS